MFKIIKLYMVLFLSIFLLGNGNKDEPTINEQSSKQFIGIWQEDDNVVSAGLKSIYRFFPDGRFIYQVSAYDYNSAYRKLEGTYRIDSTIIYLTIKYVYKIDNWDIIFDEIYCNWYTDFSKVIKTKVLHKKTNELIYSIDKKNKNNPKWIKLECYKFYNLSRIPDDEEFIDPYE